MSPSQKTSLVYMFIQYLLCPQGFAQCYSVSTLWIQTVHQRTSFEFLLCSWPCCTYVRLGACTWGLWSAQGSRQHSLGQDCSGDGSCGLRHPGPGGGLASSVTSTRWLTLRQKQCTKTKGSVNKYLIVRRQ